MAKDPIIPDNFIDPELSALIEQCNALDAEMEKLSPDERKARIAANLGIPVDASDADLEKAIEASLLADPSLPDMAQGLAQAAKMSTLMSLPKEKLDESAIRIATGMLKSYDSLAPAERRTKILGLYDLGVDATDSDLEAAVRAEIAQSFEEPIPSELAQQLVTTIVSKAAL